MRKICLEILDMIKDTIRYLGYIVFVVISGSLVLLSFASHKPLLIVYTVLIAVLELFLSYISYKNKTDSQYQKMYGKTLSIIWIPLILMTIIVCYFEWPLVKTMLHFIVFHQPSE